MGSDPFAGPAFRLVPANERETCEPLAKALLEGEMCVCDLAAAAGQSESSVSHALRLLRAHRVVQVRRAGRMAFYKLADSHVRMLLDVALTHVGHTTAIHPERR